MRKGFTLILATVALSFLAVSAMAMGPTISEVPDVYISQNDAAGNPDISASANMFRFSNALNLWDYITTGSEEAETADKVYWAYGIKDADYATKEASGDYLTGSAAHYTIGSEAPLSASEVAALNSQSLQTIAAAGALTFRNVRLSPLPDDVYSTPTKSPVTLPGNVLDFQQATLFVTDKATSESSDNVFLITIDGGADVLSMSGPSWVNVRSFSNGLETVAGGDYWLTSELDIKAISGTTPFTFSKSASVLTVNTGAPAAGADYGAYGLYAPPTAGEIAVAAGDLGKIFRLKANMSSNKAATTDNPDIRLYMNGQTQGPGQGMAEFSEGGAYGPTTTAADFSAYLWPVAAGTFAPSLMVYNLAKSNAAISINLPMTIDTINQSDLSGGTTLVDQGQGAAATFPAGTGAGQWSTGGSVTSWAPVYGFTGAPTLTSSISGTLMSIGCTTAVGALQGALVKYGASDLFTASANKIVVVKVNMNHSVSGVAPEFRIFASKGNAIGLFFLSNASNNALISTTAKDYYAVFETSSATAGLWALGLESVPIDSGAIGTLQIHRVTVTEYPKP